MMQQTGFEIDLVGLFRYLVKKLWIILGITVILGTLGLVVSQFVLPQEYVASSRVYVLNRSESAGVASADFALSDYMVSDYKALITGQNVTDSVIEALNLDMSHEELSDKITVSAESNTRVLQISVTDTDAQLAADIANCVREAASEQIKRIMYVDAVNLIYEAKVPQEPSSPDVLENTVLSAAAGGLLSACVLSAIFFLDDSIKSEEDVERYLGISTFGVIPYSVGLGRSGTGKGLYEGGFIRRRRKKGGRVCRRSM